MVPSLPLQTSLFPPTFAEPYRPEQPGGMGLDSGESPQHSVDTMFHSIPSSRPSTPGCCWQGEARSDLRGDQDSAPVWTIRG